MSAGNPHITPDILLRAYATGIFPMADGADDPDLYWVEPEKRGIIPLDAFRVSASLAKTVRQDRFEVVADRDFPAVIANCAAAPGRRETWINATIRELYGALFARDHCHTVEVYRDGTLVGGLYGVSLGAAFFGESMFHRETDASKVALVHLVARLIAGRFRLLDTQFVTSHLATFGAIEVPKRRYRAMLQTVIAAEADFAALPKTGIAGAEALAIIAGARRPG